MNTVRLVYGLGATKAGSGWLYRYLRAHPDCHLRTLKELHFFDTIEFNRTQSRLQKLARSFAALQERVAAGAKLDQATRDFIAWTHVAESGKVDDYLQYLAEGRGERTVLADITPAYSSLSAAGLGRMRDVLPDTRFVFFMRDPIERLWSHIRMVARRLTNGGAEVGQVAGEILDRVLLGKERDIADRSAYDVTLSRLKAAIPSAQLYLDFFEDVVQVAAVDRLCAFLGIRPVMDRGAHPHQGLELALAPAQRARMRPFLAQQYDTVRSEMGRLPNAWETSFAKDR